MPVIWCYARLPQADRNARCERCGGAIPRTSFSPVEATCPDCKLYQQVQPAASYVTAAENCRRYVNPLAGSFGDALMVADYCDGRLACSARSAWGRILREIRSRDHLVVSSLDCWHDAADAVGSIAAMLRIKVTVHFLDRPCIIEPQTGAADVLSLLANLDTTVKSRDQVLRKALVRDRDKPTNQYSAGRGWRWVRDEDGRPFRLPDPQARELMRLLLNWRELGWTWAEITSEVERMGCRSPHKRPYCERTLKRLYAAAQRLLRQESPCLSP